MEASHTGRDHARLRRRTGVTWGVAGADNVTCAIIQRSLLEPLLRGQVGPERGTHVSDARLRLNNLTMPAHKVGAPPHARRGAPPVPRAQWSASPLDAGY